MAEFLLQNQTENARKYIGELEAVVSYLEGRISRAREHQDSLLYTLKSNQEQFQSKIKSTMTTLHSIQMQIAERGEGVATNGESSIRGAVQTPKGGLTRTLFESPGVERVNYDGGGAGGGVGN